MESFIRERYDDKYTIIDSCGHFDESPRDYTRVLFSVEGLEYPVAAKYDWQKMEYTDNYDKVVNGEVQEGGFGY